MNDPDLLLTAISTVGFPIVAFLLMFWVTVKVIKDNTEAIKNLEGTIALWMRK